MQAAPELNLTLHPSAGWRKLALGLASAAAVSDVAWILSSDWSLLRAGPAALGIGFALWVLVHPDATRPPLRLHWTRRAWRLQEGAASPASLQGDVDVLLDLGGALLLRFRPAARRGRARMFALTQADHPGSWHALRCALYSPRLSDPKPARSSTA